MKWWIDKFDEELEKRLDDTNLFDDVGADFYIDNVKGGSNTPID